MKALVVDDSRAIRVAICNILKGISWETDEAADGLDALSKIESGGYDLALIDWHMPEMSGIELVEKLHNEKQATNTRLVMVTTESECERMSEAFNLGVSQFITKPFNHSEVIRLIEEMFAEKS